MRVELDLLEAEIVLTSLEFTKGAFEKSSYPTYEMKREKVDSVQRIITRIREERKKETKA